MNGELANVRAEQRAVTALVLAILAVGASAGALGWWLLFDWANLTVMVATGVVAAVAVSIGDGVRDQAPSKGQAAVAVSVIALALIVLQLLLMIGFSS